MSWKSCCFAMPALLTRSVIFPSSFSVLATMARTVSGSATSACAQIASAPFSRSLSHSACARSARSTQLTHTAQPAPARVSAQARPMPREEPVTRATLLMRSPPFRRRQAPAPWPRGSGRRVPGCSWP